MIRLAFVAALLCSLSASLLNAQAIQCEPKLRIHIPDIYRDSLELRTEIHVDHNAFLPSVFFSDSSDEVLPGYHLFASSEAAREFSPEVQEWMNGGLFEQHKHVLNTLGWRMRRHPEARLNLVGRYEHKAQRRRAEARAYTVAEYLSHIWNVSGERINIDTKEVERADRGHGNSHRVDLVSNSWELLCPVTVRDSVQIPNPETLVLYPDNGCDSAQVADRWLLITIDSALVLTRTPEHGLITDNSGAMWSWFMEAVFMEQWPQKSLDFQLVVRTVDGATHASIPQHLDINKWSEELFAYGCRERMYRTSILLFPSKTETKLTAQQKRCIEEYILSYAGGCHAVYITGYTDDTGSEKANLRVSQKLAEGVAREIRKHLDSDIIVEARGAGEDEERCSNDYVQGRFLNRCVSVEFRYPVEFSGTRNRRADK